MQIISQGRQFAKKKAYITHPASTGVEFTVPAGPALPQPSLNRSLLGMARGKRAKTGRARPAASLYRIRRRGAERSQAAFGDVILWQ